MFASQMCAAGLKDAKKHENVEAVWDKATADMEKLDTGKYKFGKVKHHFFSNSGLSGFRIISGYQHGFF